MAPKDPGVLTAIRSHAEFLQGAWHYGVLIDVPDGPPVRVCVRAFGRPQQWFTYRPDAGCFLVIPRRWLIRHGFLPWWIAIAPRKRAHIRRESELLAALHMARE